MADETKSINNEGVENPQNGTEEVQNTQGNENTEKKGENTFSQDDVNNIVKREIEKEKKRHAEELEQRLAEAERLSKLDADQRAKEEFEIAKNQLAEQTEALRQKELKIQARSELAEKGLPTELADILPLESAEVMSKAIDSIAKGVQTATEARVNERLKGIQPSGAGTNKDGGNKGTAKTVPKVF